MKLLIVDDQDSAIQGLMQGIDWDSLGISEVLSAQNAMEARLVFKSGAPDIMLCDIEMPVENGITLCQWVRSQKYDTHFIFLTCHAAFEYAKDALQLGASDYIVSPAPYHEIQKAIEKVIHELNLRNEHRQMLSLGKLYDRQKHTIHSSVLRNYLNGGASIKALDALSDLLSPNEPVRLILVQVVYSAAPPSQNWPPDLFLSALTNFTEDIFTREEYTSVTAALQPKTYCIALQSAEDPELLQDVNVLQRLRYLCSVFEMYMPHKVACYAGSLCSAEEMPCAWAALLAERDTNVALRSGVFSLSGTSKTPTDAPDAQPPQALNWHILFREKQFFSLESATNQALDEMVACGSLNSATLLSFYQSFLQALFDEDQHGWSATLFSTPEAISLYRNGTRSVDDMKKLVAYVAHTYAVLESEQSPKGRKEIVRSIAAYIQKNLDVSLRQEDLAAHFFMNADYLTRIFKKEMGMTIKAYTIRLKMQEAQNLFRTTQLPVSYVAAKLGYTNFSHFSSAYKKEMGLTPMEERKKAELQGPIGLASQNSKDNVP